MKQQNRFWYVWMILTLITAVLIFWPKNAWNSDHWTKYAPVLAIILTIAFAGLKSSLSKYTLSLVIRDFLVIYILTAGFALFALLAMFGLGLKEIDSILISIVLYSGSYFAATVFAVWTAAEGTEYFSRKKRSKKTKTGK